MHIDVMNVELVSNEKGVDKEIIFEALEAALASAAKKCNREDIEARVSIDRETGDYETFRRWEVIDDAEARANAGDTDETALEAPDRQVLLSTALEREPSITAGAFIEEPMPSVEYGRIAAQAARQVIMQKVREAERARVVEDYTDRVGEMFSGVVKRVERSGVSIDLGNNAEGFISRDNILQREQIHPGDRVRAWLQEVTSETKGPQLLMSRTATELLIELFKIEVPEINEGLIEIKAGARDPGHRSKIAVKAADDPRVDPIGACVGMRGSRVQAVSNELDGERVEIILWDKNPAQYVINAMAPAEALSITVDEETNTVDVVVAEDDIAKAKGRDGQNVRLASRLTGLRINVISEQQAEEKAESESQTLHAMFMEQLDVDEEVATILVQEGFTSVDEIAYIPEKEMLEIEEFDTELVTALRGRAGDVILTKSIAEEQKLAGKKPAEDLLDMEGMNEELAWKLARQDIQTMEDLAEQSTDELLEKLSDIDEEKAAALILTARQPWFEAEVEKTDSVPT